MAAPVYHPVDDGAQAITVGATAGGLTVPAGATRAMCQVLTANIRYHVDTTTATASVGFQAQAGDIIYLNNKKELDNFSAIREGGTSATLIVAYWSGKPETRSDV